MVHDGKSEWELHGVNDSDYFLSIVQHLVDSLFSLRS